MSRRPVPGLELQCRLYRWLWRLLPAHLRRRRVQEAVELFRDQLRAAHGRAGLPGVVVTWSRALKGLIDVRLAGDPLARLAPVGRSGGRRGSRWREDLRAAARTCWRSPEFTAVVVLTLALGLGATTAIFSLVHGILIEPLPYPEAERIVYLEHAAPAAGFDGGLNIAPGLFFHYAEHARGLDTIGFWQPVPAPLTGADEPEQISAARATSGMFETLGARPLLGRLFTPEDDLPDSGRTVVLSHGLWQRRYGGDEGIVGRTIEIGAGAHTVVGVLPADFVPPAPGIELWLASTRDVRNDFGGFSVEGIGRLREGVSVEGLRAELDGLIGDIGRSFPSPEVESFLADAGVRSLARPLKDRWVGDVRDTIWILQGMVGLVLLVACANVANLFLVRSESRRREIAVRVALGASRGQLLRTFLSESLLLAGVACALGVGVATLGIRTLVTRAPIGIPRLGEVDLDPVVLALSVTLALIAGLLFGAAPALGRMAAPAATLGDGGRAATAGRGSVRVRQALVIGQVALALLVLLGAGLMGRSFWRIQAIEPGFRSDDLLVFELGLPGGRYPDAAAAARFHRALVDELETLPGVESAAVASYLPLEPVQNGNVVARVDAPPAEGELPPVFWIDQVSGGLFETLEVPLVAGHTLARTDYEQALPVAVVNETGARVLWSGEDPLDDRVRIGVADGDGALTELTIVGIVADTVQNDLVSEVEPALYLPLQVSGYEQTQVYRVSYALRTRVPPNTLAASVRATIWEMDDGLPVVGLGPMSERMARARAPAAFVLLLLAIAAGVSLLLGAVGMYGVISWIVRRRTGEIGIRMALGARSGSVLRMLLAQGMVVVVLGLALGLAGSWLLAGTLESLLFEVEPLDPLTHAAVLVVLLAVGALATWLPARRAARIEPASSLREE